MFSVPDKDHPHDLTEASPPLWKPGLLSAGLFLGVAKGKIQTTKQWVGVTPWGERGLHLGWLEKKGTESLLKTRHAPVTKYCFLIWSQQNSKRNILLFTNNGKTKFWRLHVTRESISFPKKCSQPRDETAFCEGPWMRILLPLPGTMVRTCPGIVCSDWFKSHFHP